MIDFQDTAEQVDPARAGRLKRINAALFRIVSAANTLAGVVRTKLNDIRHGNEELNGVEQSILRMIGANLLRLSEISLGTKATLDVALEENRGPPEAPELPVEPMALQAAPTILPHQPEDPLDTPARQTTTATNGERPPDPPYSLYSHIVPLEEIPPIELDEETKPITIHLVSDDTITLNGETMVLKGDDLFLFNAFMMLRDKSSITAGDLRALGYRLGSSASDKVALSVAIRKFREQMQAQFGPDHRELITRQGKTRSTSYRVNPAVVLIDVVREGSSVTVEFLDGEGDSRETFRVAGRYYQPRQDDSVKLLDPKLPLSTLLIGARINDRLSYKNAAGQPVELRVVAIE